MAGSDDTPRTRRAAAVAALVVLLAAAAGVAAAAGSTEIGVSPATDTLTAGETTQVDVVVESADGGVGALNATVTLSNPGVASIEDVELHGNPSLNKVTDRPDGVAISAALADTDDTGSVTVATVVVRGEHAGSTDIRVNVRALGDEDGAAYSVSATERPSLTVTEDEQSSPDAGNAAPNDAGGADSGDGDSDGADGSDAGDGDSPETDDPDDAADTSENPNDSDDVNDPGDANDDTPQDDADLDPSTPDEPVSVSMFDPVVLALVALAVLAIVGVAVYRIW